MTRIEHKPEYGLWDYAAYAAIPYDGKRHEISTEITS